ncbi:LamG domain-containing protein, partial [bacterium]|nr:LamG domain-containing protein [bacterium]
MRTLSRAMQLASSLEPTEDMPVLIQCGQGSFSAPDADWALNARHVYFRGNGAENSRITASTITLGQDSITGFKDLAIDATLDIGDLYVPVEGVKVLSLDAASGRLVGTYYDAAGRLHTSSDTVSNPVPLDTNRYERGGDQILVAPDQDASNTFVLKAGDVMTGLLTLSGAPTQPLHASSKDYVDAVSNAAAALYLRKTGDAMSGPLDMGGNAISNVGAITFNTASLPCQTGIVLWLDASSLSGLSDGQPVQTWDDRGPQNNDATCSGTPATYRAGVLNDEPVIRFTGTNSYYSFAAINDIRGVFWVMMEDADAANNFHPVLGHSTTYQFHRGYNKEIYGDTWAPAAIKNGQTRINGQLVNGTATVVPTTFSLISLITAGDVSANQFGEDRSLGRYWDGDVAEIIIYNVALTDAQREATEEYLSRKYALGAYSNAPPFEPLTIDGTGIHNAPAPQNDGDAATKAYVDIMSTGSVADARYVRKDGDTMLGVLNMSSNRVAGLGQPTAMRDATTKEYVDQGMELLTSGLAVTGTASAASGGGDWEYATECLELGGNEAVTSVTVADPTSSWLYVTGWNVSVPERAVIKGVSLRVLFSGYAFNPTNYCSAVLNA